MERGRLRAESGERRRLALQRALDRPVPARPRVGHVCLRHRQRVVAPADGPGVGGREGDMRALGEEPADLDLRVLARLDPPVDLEHQPLADHVRGVGLVVGQPPRCAAGRHQAGQRRPGLEAELGRSAGQRAALDQRRRQRPAGAVLVVEPQIPLPGPAGVRHREHPHGTAVELHPVVLLHAGDGGALAAVPAGGGDQLRINRLRHVRSDRRPARCPGSPASRGRCRPSAASGRRPPAADRSRRASAGR